MKKLLFFIFFFFIFISIVDAQNQFSTYYDWLLYGEGVNEGVYDKPSFYWKVVKEIEPKYGYYHFYLYLFSNSGLTSYNYNKTQTQQIINEYEKRPTEFYDLRIKVCMDETKVECVYIGESFWWLADWKIEEPITFEVSNENPVIYLEWKSLRVY